MSRELEAHGHLLQPLSTCILSIQKFKKNNATLRHAVSSRPKARCYNRVDIQVTKPTSQLPIVPTVNLRAIFFPLLYLQTLFLR